MEIVKDSTCGKTSPIIHGHLDTPIYEKSIPIKPHYPGRRTTAYDKKVFLAELLPLHHYNSIIVLFSGGKDSAAAYFRLLELGVPKEKIQLWHHDIDGGHPTRRMDWPVTQAYVRSFAAAEGVKLRISWRVNGFFGELYRIGASFPIEYEDDGEIKICRLSDAQIKSEKLREEILYAISPKEQEMLEEYGKRLKFPAKSGDLSRRWCSAYLKCSVADTVIRNLEELKGIGVREKFPAKSGCQQGRWCSGTLKAEVQNGVTVNLQQTRSDTKILIVSGERRGESAGRSRNNEMEYHRTNATAKAHRLVHHWRAVIDYSLRDVWEIIKRHNLTPHPCYSCGWGRCSCMCCIFSLPCHWAGIRDLFPSEFELLCQDENHLGFTLDNKKSLKEYTGDAKSCVYRGDKKALSQLIAGQFTVNDVYTKGDWAFPAGAFKGTDGGSC